MDIYMVVLTLIVLISIVGFMIIAGKQKTNKINRPLSESLNKTSNKLGINHEKKLEDSGTATSKKMATTPTRINSMKALSHVAEKMSEIKTDGGGESE